MNIFAAFRVALLIGHGPSTLDLFGRVIFFALGVALSTAAFQRGTRIRAAFSFGKGPSVPIGSAGRLILGLVALVMFLLAFGIVH